MGASILNVPTLNRATSYLAGGREVYHQSRARSGRHKHGSKQRHSGDFSQHPSVAPEDAQLAAANKRRSTGYLYESQFNEQVKSAYQHYAS